MNKMPNLVQAGAYSSTLHYLHSVQAGGRDEALAVMATFCPTPFNDMFAKNRRICEDGRMMRDMYAFDVKQPTESRCPLVTK